MKLEVFDDRHLRRLGKVASLESELISDRRGHQSNRSTRKIYTISARWRS